MTAGLSDEEVADTINKLRQERLPNIYDHARRAESIPRISVSVDIINKPELTAAELVNNAFNREEGRKWSEDNTTVMVTVPMQRDDRFSQKTATLFGVFDGHRGREISDMLAEQFSPEFKKQLLTTLTTIPTFSQQNDLNDQDLSAVANIVEKMINAARVRMKGIIWDNKFSDPIEEWISQFVGADLTQKKEMIADFCVLPELATIDTFIKKAHAVVAEGLFNSDNSTLPMEPQVNQSENTLLMTVGEIGFTLAPWYRRSGLFATGRVWNAGTFRNNAREKIALRPDLNKPKSATAKVIEIFKRPASSH